MDSWLTSFKGNEKTETVEYNIYMLAISVKENRHRIWILVENIHNFYFLQISFSFTQSAVCLG